jgi:succinoglycan biosynthesis protein ExoA
MFAELPSVDPAAAGFAPIEPSSPPKKVAVIIPTLNEADHIGGLLSDFLRQGPAVVEIIVADGGSEDGTRAIVERMAATEPRIRLIDNPGRLQAAGFNLAAAQASLEVDTLIRVDAHAIYPPDFVETLLAEQAASGAESVVNRLQSVGTGGFQTAVAVASNSIFGTGGAAHRQGAPSCYIDHGHHALFDRATFLSLEGYDEAFAANEDAEYDVRLRGAGGRIWFTNKADIAYFPRRSPGALARQYYRYGAGRAQTLIRHAEPLRWRQRVPALLLVVLAISLLFAPVFPSLLAIPIAYVAGLVGATLILMIEERQLSIAGALLALPIMHLCWGAGFLSYRLSHRRPAAYRFAALPEVAIIPADRSARAPG